MALPECVDLGGEEPASFGICPVDYYVPSSSWDEQDADQIDGAWGFVAGCIWCDDSTWKIQFLDLARASQGVVLRDARFGHLELAPSQRLRDAIDPLTYDPAAGSREVGIAHLVRYSIDKLDAREHLRRRIAELQQQLALFERADER